MEPSRPKLHPLLTVAAVAVILFSVVGIAAVTGLIPGVFSKSTPTQSAAPAGTASTTSPAATAEAAKAETKTAKATEPETAKPEAAKAEAKPATSKSTHKATAPRSQVVRSASEPPPPPRTAEAPPPICPNCGVIESVRAVEKAGEGSGLGAIAGGVAGALLGHQVGEGTGKDIATIAGAVGGGYAGHQIEKQVKKTTVYEITVRMEDGTRQVITQQTESGFRPGDKVRIVNGAIVAR